MKQPSVRLRVRLAAAAAAALTMTGTLVVLAAPAQAASCSTGMSADRHTAWAYCTSSQPTTGTFRVKARFCTLSGCDWVYGPWKYIGGGAKSSVTRSVWVNGNDVFADMGPAGS
ncbi:hypothetical protein [Microtetraspora malaysiensis]|uniref:hypothetical protein n=1 Tax=Microtetraspora malaysiensis TaxID=161358 RepID=UPI003D8E6E71